MKRVIIVILSTLILASLGLIGYLVIKQNNPSSLSVKNTAPVATNPFPIANQNTQEANTSTSSNSLTTETLNSNPSAQSVSGDGTVVVEGLEITGLNSLSLNKRTESFFIDKEKGNIYSLDSQNNITRQSFTTIPAVGEAYLSLNNGLVNVIIRQLKGLNITNLVGQLKLSTTGEPNELTFQEWKTPFVSLSVSPDGKKLAYLSEESNKGVLYVSDWTLAKPKKLWSSELSSWLVAYPTNNIISLTTKASYNYPGLNYLLDITTGKIKRTISNINGLSVSVSPSGDKILYSKSLLGGFSLYTYDIKAGESRLLDINTLPDKCSWLDSDIVYCAIPRNIPAGQYPDVWYQGKISFIDNIWRIDLKQKTTTLISQPRGNYDLINLSINKETGWLYALNRGDNKLQAFSLKP